MNHKRKDIGGLVNYYTEIKNELINNEVTKRVKDYSKNRSDLTTYYNVGRLLSEAGKHYGEGIIKEYSKKLTAELGKNYSETTLKYYRLFYKFSIRHSVSDELSYTYYKLLLSIKEDNKIDYYIKMSIEQNLSVRQLRERIKSKEYERLDNSTKNKLITNTSPTVIDFIKNPIVIKNTINKEIISEKVLQQLVLDDLDSFLKELGNSFSYVGIL